MFNIGTTKEPSQKLKRESSEMLNSFEIDAFRTPQKKLKKNESPNSQDFLSNTEKSLTYLHSKAGTKPQKIAVQLKRSKKTVTGFLKKVNTVGTFEPLHSNKGRFRKGEVKLNIRQKDLLRKWLKEEEMRSSRQCFIRLNKVKNLPRSSYKSVHTFINSLGGFVRPKLKSVVSEQNKKKRLAYCQQYHNFNFHKVLFSDESSFQLNANNLKAFRFKGSPPPKITKYNPNFKIMVWGGISYQGKLLYILLRADSMLKSIWKL